MNFKIAFLAAVLPLFVAGCSPKGSAAATAETAAVQVIHITDLTRPHGDPDDHWDAATQFALNKKGVIDLRAVITDNLPALGEPDIAGLAQLNWITGAGVPVGVGETVHDGSVHSGLALLKKTLEEADAPVAIHVVGGCLDLAAAAKMWPDLFKEKVKAVYLNAGSAEESPTLEYNVALHPEEYSEMFALPCPLYWMPCLQNTDEWCAKGGVLGVNSTYFRFTQGRLFKDMRPDLLNYFLFALKKSPASGWFEALDAPCDDAAAAEFGAQVRNMWCTAGFLHCAGLTVWKDGSVQPLGKDAGQEVFRFVPVEVSCSPEGRVTWSRTEKECGRFIFEVTDLDAYEEAMTRALGEIMSYTSADRPETPGEGRAAVRPCHRHKGGCTVTGKVMDALGNKAVKGIKVELGGSRAVTDSEGVFRIERYPIDSEDLTVRLHLEDRIAEYELLRDELIEHGTITLPDFFSGYDERDGMKIQKVGEMWALIPDDIRAKETGSVQGLAIDGDDVFFFHDKGGYSCFSLSRMRHLYSGDTDPEDIYGLHCNEAFFGPARLSPDSEHPLVYVSACIWPFNIYVYDISSEGSALVGVLDMPDDIGERPEKSYGISSYSYDADNGWLYGHNTNFIRRYRFPSFSEFKDGNYKMKQEDFLKEMFFDPALTLPQGACAVDGRLYMPSGLYPTDRCCIYIYDFKTDDLSITGIDDLQLEPEGIEFSDGWFYVAFNHDGKEVLYRFKF